MTSRSPSFRFRDGTTLSRAFFYSSATALAPNGESASGNTAPAGCVIDDSRYLVSALCIVRVAAAPPGTGSLIRMGVGAGQMISSGLV
jgi:hypothetical protein